MSTKREREINEDWLTCWESELRIYPTWFGLTMFNNRRRTANVDIQEKKRRTKETRKRRERIISIKPIRRRKCEDCQCTSIWGWGKDRRRSIPTKQFVRHWEILRRRTFNERHEHSVRSRERQEMRFNEDGSGYLMEQSPFSDVWRSIRQSVGDVPSDISLSRTTVEGKQRRDRDESIRKEFWFNRWWSIDTFD